MDGTKKITRELFEGQTGHPGTIHQQMRPNLMDRRGFTDEVNETQTQEETQQIDSRAQKRPAPLQDEMHDMNPVRPKKIKMSLAIGVDLAE